MGAPHRLTPTMASRKLLALDFIKGYFPKWGASPSLREIANALGATRQPFNRSAVLQSLDGKHKLGLPELGIARRDGEEQVFIERVEQPGTIALS